MLKNYRLSCFRDLTINALISIILFAQLSEMLKRHVTIHFYDDQNAILSINSAKLITVQTFSDNTYFLLQATSENVP
jgi:hypothetical protein